MDIEKVKQIKANKFVITLRNQDEPVFVDKETAIKILEQWNAYKQRKADNQVIITDEAFFNVSEIKVIRPVIQGKADKFSKRVMTERIKDTKKRIERLKDPKKYIGTEFYALMYRTFFGKNPSDEELKKAKEAQDKWFEEQHKQGKFRTLPDVNVFEEFRNAKPPTLEDERKPIAGGSMVSVGQVARNVMSEIIERQLQEDINQQRYTIADTEAYLEELKQEAIAKFDDIDEDKFEEILSKAETELELAKIGELDDFNLV